MDIRTINSTGISHALSHEAIQVTIPGKIFTGLDGGMTISSVLLSHLSVFLFVSLIVSVHFLHLSENVLEMCIRNHGPFSYSIENFSPLL